MNVGPTMTMVTSMHLDSSDCEPRLMRILTFASDSTMAGFPPNIWGDDNMKEKVQHMCWKCSQVLFAHDLRQNWGKHSLISTGKTLTQDKLADCKVSHMTVRCMITNINSAWGAEASQGPGTTVWTFLEGQPRPQSAPHSSASWVASGRPRVGD